MVRVKVILYERLVELAGVSYIELELPKKPRLKDLLETLGKKFGKDFENVVATPSDAYGNYLGVILINERESKRLNDLETELKENDVIRIVPPVSGG